MRFLQILIWEILMALIMSPMGSSAMLGLKMDSEFELFLNLPIPQVRFYGAAARESGSAFASILEFTASTNFYLVVVELPHVEFCDVDIEWVVHGHGEVLIEGQMTPSAIFSNFSTGQNTKRVQLCPSEPWGMSFNFPGPVDLRTFDVLFTSKFLLEISVMKVRPPPLLLILPFPPFVPFHPVSPFPPVEPPMPNIQDLPCVLVPPIAPGATGNLEGGG